MGAQEIDVGDRDMRDLIKELVEARNKKIYKDNDFKTILSFLKGINTGNKINWDEGAGEEWAFINNQSMSIMLNAKIGIYFIRGKISEEYLKVLNEGNCVYVSNFDLKEWYMDLKYLQKNIPEIIWHTSGDSIDTNGFSLDELYFATV
ncbi:MAG: hypothetical protein IIY49_09560 [Eubacterium sp.]|nr:hypothetical protein [Eubacterium sp.]